MRYWISIVLSLTLLLPQLAMAQGANQYQLEQQGNPTREFIMSCTYGVLAGTLVGAASLAFTDKPGESLHRVARGASLGLYTGILLGLYVVYVVPGMEEPEPEEDPVVRVDKLPFLLAPRIEDDRLAGLDLTVRLLRF